MCGIFKSRNVKSLKGRTRKCGVAHPWFKLLLLCKRKLCDDPLGLVLKREAPTLSQVFFSSKNSFHVVQPVEK